MNYYFAPMEGLTDSIYRRLHHKYFPGVNRYYTPFFSPTVHRALTPKEQRELPPAASLPFTVIPQLLTKEPADFLWMAKVCKDLGYEEVNLNLGCPSGTVTAKGKGSGMLCDLEGLDRFLDEIFYDAPLPISVKTRIGFSSPEEFPRLMDIFNRYPIRELTIHPRVRTYFYKGTVHTEWFSYALANANMSLCYNGDITNREQADSIENTFPGIGSVMIGRGLIGDPGMVTEGGSTPKKMEEFYGELLEQYSQAFGSSRNAMFRMKENWRYISCRFDHAEKLYKQLRKTTDLSQYKTITHEIFSSCPLKSQLTPDW